MIKKCLNCGNQYKSKVAKYCSKKCQLDFQYKKYIDRWLKGEESGGGHGINNAVSNHVRRWLIETNGNKCSICKNTKWLGKDIPLIVDHKNGDSTDHSEKNTRLICGNCDMLLPTFAGRNKGNGRKIRREMYHNKGQ